MKRFPLIMIYLSLFLATGVASAYIDDTRTQALKDNLDALERELRSVEQFAEGNQQHISELRTKIAMSQRQLREAEGSQP